MKIINEDCLIALDKFEENSIDSIVTDPPYGLNFMGKEWDNVDISFKKEMWQKCLRVLKPGGYLLAFGGSRTFHRIATAIEDAGFEIRDTIMWLYGSGFPKSMSLGKVIEGKQVLGSANVRDIKKLDGIKENVTGGWNSNEVEQGKRNIEYNQVKTTVNYTTELGKKWQGWGTCLKPSFEPIIVARKPFKGSLVDNVIEYGVGGINIDECRVGNEQIKTQGGNKFPNLYGNYNETVESFHNGRFPANTILTYDQITFDEVCGGFPYTKSQKTNSKLLDIRGNNYNNSNKNLDISYERGFNDSGSAARYFYCAKASKKDRDEGLDEFEEKTSGQLTERKEESAGITAFAGSRVPKKNIHPTVKPTELMQYLIRLVTPKGGTVLDPFMGSGSTGKAVMFENKERQANYKFIGIEKEKEYCDIAEARIKWAEKER